MTVEQHAFQTCLHLGEVLVPKCTVEKAEKSSGVAEESVEKEKQSRKEQLQSQRLRKVTPLGAVGQRDWQVMGLWLKLYLMPYLKIQRKRMNKSYLPKQRVCVLGNLLQQVSLSPMDVWLL